MFKAVTRLLKDLLQVHLLLSGNDSLRLGPGVKVRQNCFVRIQESSPLG
jgi:hypothetical protein